MKAVIHICTVLFIVHIAKGQTMPSSLNYVTADQIDIDYNYPFLNEGPVDTRDETIKYRISVVAKNATTQTAFIFYFGMNAADPVLSNGISANHYFVKTKLLESDFPLYLKMLNTKKISIAYQDLLLFPPTVRISKSLE
jgi:hypothetical protein